MTSHKNYQMYLIRLNQKKNFFEKILKYYVYIGLMKLFEKIKFNRNNMIKQYKIKLMNYLKNIKMEFNSSLKRKKRNYLQFKSLKQKQNVDTNKKFDKFKTKNQGILILPQK